MKIELKEITVEKLTAGFLDSAEEIAQLLKDLSDALKILIPVSNSDRALRIIAALRRKEMGNHD